MNKEELKEGLIEDIDMYTNSRNEAEERESEVYYKGKTDGVYVALKSIDQLDETEMTYEQAVERIANRFNVSTLWFGAMAETLIRCAPSTLTVDELEGFLQPEKVVVPDFVGEFIDGYKEQGYTGTNAVFNIVSRSEDMEMEDYLRENLRTFIDAWDNGYTVEKEPKYIIKLDDASYLQRFEIDNKNIVTLFRIVGHLKEVAVKFENKEKAEKVAELVEGKVEELEE